MKVWRLITHHMPQHKEEMLTWATTVQRLAIGWGKIGNLTDEHHISPDSIRAAVQREYPDAGNAACGGQSLWDLWRTVRFGHLVILSTGGKREAVRRVAGPYEFVRRQQPSPVRD